MKFQGVILRTKASISTGLVVKRKQAMNLIEVDKRYQMLTLKSFESSGWLNHHELEVFESNEVLNEKYLTQKGDVVVRLSYPNTAIAISENDVGLLIPSLFAVIRLNSDEILPEYLSVYLNSEHMKKEYSKSLIGSAVQIIKTSLLKEVEIKIPELDRQCKIVEINRLMMREKILLQDLIKEKTKMYNMIMNEMIV